MFGSFLAFSCVAPPASPDPLFRCSIHSTEKVNIYCLTCGLLTCSLCKVFGAHQSCQVVPLTHICQQKKVPPTRWRVYRLNVSLSKDISACVCVCVRMSWTIMSNLWSSSTTKSSQSSSSWRTPAPASRCVNTEALQKFMESSQILKITFMRHSKIQMNKKKTWKA